MTGQAIAILQRGLPRLSGGLLWAYRILWAILAAASVALLAMTFFHGAMQPLVFAIRATKSLILIAVAILLLCKRPRDPVAALLALAFLCWTITSSVDFTSSVIWAMLLDRLRFLLFALALLLFPDGKWRPRWTRPVAAVSIAIFALGVVEAIGIVRTELFLPLAIACVLAAITSLIQRFLKTNSETQKLQLKWVALGVVTGVGLILSARAGAALARPNIAIEAVFQVGIVLVALGFLVPLLRYRLYDAETVISRSAGYAVLTAALVAVFAGSESLIENLGQQYLGSGVGQVSGAMAAAVAAVLLAPLHDRIGNWAEVRFQRDLVRFKRDLPAFLADAPLSWSPQQIGTEVLPRIAGAIHATSAAIVIDRKVIASDRTSARQVLRSLDQFPLQLRLRDHAGELRGSLLIGPRPDGSPFGRDETEAVGAVMPALRRSLLASVHRQTEARRLHRIERSLRAELDCVTTKLERLEKHFGLPA